MAIVARLDRFRCLKGNKPVHSQSRAMALGVFILGDMGQHSRTKIRRDRIGSDRHPEGGAWNRVAAPVADPGHRKPHPNLIEFVRLLARHAARECASTESSCRKK